MPLNKRQAELLQTLVTRGVLEKPKLGSMKLPRIPTQAPTRNTKSDYGSYLLTNATGNKGVAKAMSRSLASNKSAEEEERGILTRLFDYISIPLYTMSNIVDEVTEDGVSPNESAGENWNEFKGVVGEIGKGLGALAGPFTDDLLSPIGDRIPDQQKQTMQNVLHENFGVKNKFARHGGGLGLDILLDPLTYVGGIGLIGAGRRAKNATEALDSAAAVPEAILKRPKPTLNPPVAEQALRGRVPSNLQAGPPSLPKVNIPEQPVMEPLTRALQRKPRNETGLTAGQMRAARSQKLPPPYGKDLTERLVRNQEDWERKLTKLGKVSEGSRLNLKGANQVIRQIEEGKVPRVLPKPLVATGADAERARDIADDVIDTLMGQKKNKGKKLTWRGPGGKIQSRKLPPELTASMQIALLNKIMGATGSKNIEEAIGSLRAAEDHLIALGVQPTRHEGVRVRLSDVLNLMKDRIDTEVPFETVLNNFARKDIKKMEPVVRQAIQTVAAYRSATMSDILENLTTYAERAKRSANSSYVGRQKTAAEAEIIDDSLARASAMGATANELNAIKNLIKDVVDVDKLPAEKFFTQASDELMKAFKQGRVQPELIVKFNKMVADSYGYTKTNLHTKISGNRVVDTIMGNMLTHWGKGSLFPKAKGLFDSGSALAQARAQALRRKSEEYTKDEIKNAWKVVTGHADETIADARTMEMANWFRGYFDSVLKIPSYAMKLENATTKHLSVAERQVMFMKDVNRHLKDMNGVAAFQFSNKAIARDAWDQKRNFSDSGEGWTASWAMSNPEDPLKFLYDVDLAMERASREYAFLDNFVDVFGSLEKSSYHNWQVNNSRIKGFYVPEQIGRQMERIMDDVHKGQWQPRTPLTRFYSKGLRVWKTSVTIYLPSHHIRNGIGDMYLMWLAGHNNPQSFIHAKRIMHSQKGRYKQAIKDADFQQLEEFTDPNAMRWAATNGKDVILKQKNTKVTAEELYVNALHRGLLRNANQLEDIFGESRIGIRPLGGHAHNTATGAAEYREHFIRLAHFTSAVNKKIKKGRKDMDSIYDEAANEVRKWHPDGTDLTYFEQRYLRQMMPFYSWIRKSTPLLVEGLITRPAKALVYPRGMVALQNMAGIESTIADPFPDDQLFPDWLKETGIGPIGDAESDNPFARWWGNLGRNMINFKGEEYGYTIVNPGNPLIDQGRHFLGSGDLTDLPKNIGTGLFDSLTPFVKVPTDLARDEEFTGAPIYKDSGGRGVVQYLMKQFGATSPIQRYFDIGEDKANPREGLEPQTVDIPAIINNLTAAGVYGTAPYIKGAEIEQGIRLRAQRKNQ